MHIVSLCDVNNVNAMFMLSAAEEQQILVPSLAALSFGVGGSLLYPENELEIRDWFLSGLKVLGAVGGYGISEAFNWIPKPIPMQSVFRTLERDILIPLDLVCISAENVLLDPTVPTVWTGIFWSPVYGKKHIFNGNNNNGSVNLTFPTVGGTISTEGFSIALATALG